MKIKYNEIEYIIHWKHFIHNGETACNIKVNGIPVALGLAMMAEDEKNYCKCVGRKISLTRALGSLTATMGKEDAYNLRTAIWNEYKNLGCI